MIRYYLFSAACLAFALCNAQNLVPNPGFETFSMCPVGFSQFNGYVNNWTDPSAASPDYYNACANPFPAGVPHNGTGWQQPHAGAGYAGCYLTANASYTEYLQVHLISPLVAGTTYQFKMYVVLHNRSKFATDDIGAYISTTAPSSLGSAMLNGSPMPQIANPLGNVISDSLNWHLISGSYLATGGEQYLTIGHFRSDISTTYALVNYGTQGTYYYFDDISLVPGISLPVELTVFNAIWDNGAAHLSWTTATEHNNAGFEVQRSSDNEHFTVRGWAEGQGNSLSEVHYAFDDRDLPDAAVVYYRLKQEDIDGSTELSQVIAVNIAAGTDLTAYWTTDGIEVALPADAPVLFEYMDPLGRVMAEAQRQGHAGMNHMTRPAGITVGMHLVRITCGEQVVTLLVPPDVE